MDYQKIVVPTDGDRITVNADLSLNVSNNPIIPFIEGDGIGTDITPVMKKVVDAAVQRAYLSKRSISWMEVYCGEKATHIYDANTWLPAETLEALREFPVSVKGPLTTPVGEGFRSEGAFKNWGYELAKERFGAEPLDGGPWQVMKNPNTGKEIIIKDVIADAFLQQILMRPDEYSVIATLNLNGDYISDALAAEVGGIGIAPGANMGGSVANLEATHGTAPKYAGQDKVNPGSLILSAEMMLRHMGWTEAADLVIKGMEGAIAAKTVTYDFERLMPDATLLKCSEFGDAVIKNMDE